MRINYYVSVDGNDSDSGSMDSPFQTIARAKEAVQKVNKKMEDDIIVFICEGKYFLDSPLIFTQEDSGYNGHHVVYQAVTGAHVEMSGGMPITDWVLDDKKKNIYKASVPVGTQSRQFYVNKRRVTRAKSIDVGRWLCTKEGFEVPNDVTKWNNFREVEIVGRYDWKMFRGKIDFFRGNEAVMQQPFWNNSQINPPWKLTKLDWVENAHELLSEAGEFYLDTSAGMIYYIPLTNENMEESEAILPIQEYLVKGYELQNVKIEGLTCCETTWLKTDESDGYCPTQAGCMMSGFAYNGVDHAGDFYCQMDGSISFCYSKNIILENNTFTRLGNCGVKFGRGSRGNHICGNHFFDISGSAIQLGQINDHYANNMDLVKGNLIKQNEINNIACEYEDCPAILVGMTQETVITHNTIHDISYTGISIGWGWGHYDGKETVQRKNNISFNHIYSYMQTMMDGGGIYHLSKSPDSIISYNYIHDSGQFCPAIYLDNGSHYVKVKKNVINNVHEAISAQNVPNVDNVIEENYYPSTAEFNVCDTNIIRNNVAVENENWPVEARNIIKECHGLLTIQKGREE